MDIKLILSDIDGTILNNKNEIDSGLKSAVAKLKQKEIPFVLASARSPEGMLPIAKELDVLDNPIACYNGALVVKNLQNKDYSTILNHELNIDEIKKIISTAQRLFPNVSVNIYSGSDWYVEKVDRWVKIESDITNLTPIVMDLNSLIEDHKVPIHKILLISEPEEITQILINLRGGGFLSSLFYLSKPNYLEITNSDVSKEKALRELARLSNLSIDKTMALGDNFNDIPMLKIAGLGVAMENAPSEVKKCANVVTDTNNHNGVSKAIEKYVLD